MRVQPYLFFEGRAEEAIEFYKKTLGAKVEMLMRFKDSAGSIDVLAGRARTRSCMLRSRSATPRC